MQKQKYYPLVHTMQKQEYTLQRENNLGRHFGKKKPDFVKFYKLICDSGINKAFNSDRETEEWAKLVYKNMESPQITVITGVPGNVALYSGDTLLLKIRDNHIIKVCLPGVKSLRDTYMFCGHDFEYTLWAKFPDLEDGGDYFLDRAYDLHSLYVPKLKRLGREALAYSQLPKFKGPELVRAGDYFLYRNERMDLFKAPKLVQVGRGCLWENNVLDCNTPKEMEEIDGDGLLYAPNLDSAGIYCHPLIYSAIEANHSK